jgi:histidine ammonia-lyase
MRAPLRPAPATGAVIAALRDVVPGPGPDRVLSPELLAAESFLDNGEPTVALEAVEITLS